MANKEIKVSEMKLDTNSYDVELVLARDIIPVLTFVYKPDVYYSRDYIKLWRENLMNVWVSCETTYIGLRRNIEGINVLAHSEDMWFTTKDAALKWANEAGLNVLNPDFI